MAENLFIVLTYFTAEIFMHMITRYLTCFRPCWLLYNIHVLCNSLTVACRYYNPESFLELLKVTVTSSFPAESLALYLTLGNLPH